MVKRNCIEASTSLKKKNVKKCIGLKSDTVMDSTLQNSAEPVPILRRSERKLSKQEVRVEPAIKVVKANIIKELKQILTPIQRANIIWTELTSKKNEYSVGSIVCAKMSPFWAWPARIIKTEKINTHVMFFGDLTHGSVPTNQCVPFVECSKMIYFYLQSIPAHIKTGYLDLIHFEYDEQQRSKFLRKMPRRAIFMQSLEDINLYCGSSESILKKFLLQQN